MVRLNCSKSADPDYLWEFLGPKMAVPTRTWVAPSATAASRSSVMPIERQSRVRASPWFSPFCSSLSLLKTSRCRSKFDSGTGTAISPRNSKFGNSYTALAIDVSSPGAIPDLVFSPCRLTCKKIFKGTAAADRKFEKFSQIHELVLPGRAFLSQVQGLTI